MNDLSNHVLTEVRGKTGVITLNNPAKRNALSQLLLGALVDALGSFKAQQLPVVVMRSVANANVWSAGHDIKELPKHSDPLGFYDPLETTIRTIREYPGPVIAMIQGGVWGGACDMVLSCDMVIGDHSSTFAITPVKLGLPYNASGILHFINALGLNRAKEMFFTADPIPAERALQFGILNHLIDSDKLEEFTFGIASRIGAHSSLSIAVIKEQFRVLSNAHAVSPETFERIQGLRRQVYFSSDYAEGIKAFLEKRPPVFTGQ